MSVSLPDGRTSIAYKHRGGSKARRSALSTYLDAITYESTMISARRRRPRRGRNQAGSVAGKRVRLHRMLLSLSVSNVQKRTDNQRSAVGARAYLPRSGATGRRLHNERFVDEQRPGLGSFDLREPSARAPLRTSCDLGSFSLLAYHQQACHDQSETESAPAPRRATEKGTRGLHEQDLVLPHRAALRLG